MFLKLVDKLSLTFQHRRCCQQNLNNTSSLNDHNSSTVYTINVVAAVSDVEKNTFAPLLNKELHTKLLFLWDSICWFTLIA